MDWLQDGVDNPNQRWVRVCQPWAGHQFGTLFWPRVGGEVALAFEGGDPDRPIVVGGLYSLWNLPPESYDGVPQGWLSGIVSRPKPGDGITDEMFNFVKIYDDTNCQVLVHSATSNFDVSSGNSFKVCRGGSVQVSGSLL
jgi:type VI secretion system secreted protein VgrG